MYPPRYILLFLLICIPAAMRVVEHPWNFAPIGALALFCGVYLREKSWAFIVPIAAMFLSDLTMGWQRNDWSYAFHTLKPLIYACYALSVFLGLGVRKYWDSLGKNEELRQRPASTRLAAKAIPVSVSVLAGAILFYVVTNFGVWMFFPTYPHTVNGLVECYVAAIPYFKRTLAGDAFYATVLFGSYALLKVRVPALQETKLLHAD